MGYDSNGLRVWKENSGGRRYYLYAGDTPICEMDSNGSVIAVNTFGANGLISRRESGTSEFYAFDPLGSVSQKVDSSGSILAHSLYDAYGNKLNGGTSAPYGYGAQAGYITDSESGLMLLTHRYYDPAEGRFLTRDPIGYAGGVNLYAYCGNNPVGWVDPLGLHTLVFGGTRLKLFDDNHQLIKWMPAYSGSPGTGKNDTKSGIGPIPEGNDYYIDPSKIAKYVPNESIDYWTKNTYYNDITAWGKMRVKINVRDKKDFKEKYPKRDPEMFSMHGGDYVGSHGCIDMGHREVEMLRLLKKECKGEEVKLIVDYSSWNKNVPKPEILWP